MQAGQQKLILTQCDQ